MRILMTGSSTQRGGTVAQRLQDLGHKLFRVGKGGPDYNVDFQQASKEDVRKCFSLATARLKGFPKGLVLNARIDGEGKSAFEVDSTLMAQSFFCNVYTPLLMTKFFLEHWRTHSFEESDPKPTVVVIGAPIVDFISNFSENALHDTMTRMHDDTREEEFWNLYCIVGEPACYKPSVSQVSESVAWHLQGENRTGKGACLASCLTEEE